MRGEASDSEVERQVLVGQNYIVTCEKAALEDQVATLGNRSEQLEDQVSSLVWEKDVLVSKLARCKRQLACARVDGAVARGNLLWMLEKGVVCIIDKVIESAKFANGIWDVCEACEALGFEKGKRMGGRSASAGEPKVPDPGCVARRAEKVDVALSSLAETYFVGLFCLGELDYDGFR
ncbi:unnamed protein product [Lactuca saligna]|uniref:Uncharacterized protein n=1 Tax=Lactuca saligna TaxID=75948 RepID=A0AA36A6V2_LACSI|nr:unnamed protein product [Lactuca saligna]